MAQRRPVGCILASALTILLSIVLLTGALTVAKNTSYLRDYWTQIYGLAVFSAVIAILVIIAAVGLIYVVNGQLPALTTLFSVRSSKSVLSYIQHSFQCCGVERATDWKDRAADQMSTPDSCCKVITIGCGKGSLIKQDRIYLRGCAQPLYHDFRRKYSTLIATNLALIIFALMSAGLGIIHERYIRQHYQSM